MASPADVHAAFLISYDGNNRIYFDGVSHSDVVDYLAMLAPGKSGEIRMLANEDGDAASPWRIWMFDTTLLFAHPAFGNIVFGELQPKRIKAFAKTLIEDGYVYNEFFER